MIDHDQPYPDELIRSIFREVKTIAIIGCSPDPTRDSFEVAGFLRRKGYQIVPVNSTVAGDMIHGENVLSSLAESKMPVDMADIFRASRFVPAHVDEAIKAGVKVIWMQLGVRDLEAARKAEAAGIVVVMNRCPKIEFARLGIKGAGG